MSAPSSSPAPAPGVTPRIPLPPPLEVAKRDAERVGKVYGKFKADLEQEYFYFFETPFLGGIALWDRMKSDERLKHLGIVQAEFNKLPKLPIAVNLAMSSAIREGFESGANAAYESRRFEYQAVWTACELAKAAAIGIASAPSVAMIGSSTGIFADCCAQTGSRIIQEMIGVEASASFLVRTFGLPRASISNYKDAVAYALHWFEGIGIKLAPKPGGFYPGGIQGKYVIFLEGGVTRGHAVYGEVTATGVRLIDNRLGSVWQSIEAAQGKLGMPVRAAYRVESVTVP